VLVKRDVGLCLILVGQFVPGEDHVRRAGRFVEKQSG
jgi:hypothetical protein